MPKGKGDIEVNFTAILTAEQGAYLAESGYGISELFRILLQQHINKTVPKKKK